VPPNCRAKSLEGIPDLFNSVQYAFLENIHAIRHDAEEEFILAGDVVINTGFGHMDRGGNISH
jgi:hypothetical protein